MPLKNNYEIFDDDSNFDLDMLHQGEIAVEFNSFKERNAKGMDIIEIGCKIVWASQAEDQEHIGAEFKHTIFLGQKNGVTVKILRDTLRKANFDVASWLKDSDTPSSLMVPASLKLLVWKNSIVAGKVTKSTNDEGTRTFFNPNKILREVPGTGEPYPDALPNPVPNSLVLEAVDVEGLEGEDFNYGANQKSGGDIPV